jgi:outer membrane protein
VDLKTQSDDVEALKKQYQAQAEKLSDEEKNSRAKTIDTKQKALQRNYEDAQAEFQQAEQDVINRIGSKMVGVLEKYANANGFAVVLDVSNPQTSPVLWATQASVITKDLVDAYDKENPAGISAPAPKPAGSAGTATRPASAPTRPAIPAPTPKKP